MYFTLNLFNFNEEFQYEINLFERADQIANLLIDGVVDFTDIINLKEQLTEQEWEEIKLNSIDEYGEHSSTTINEAVNLIKLYEKVRRILYTKQGEILNSITPSLNIENMTDHNVPYSLNQCIDIFAAIETIIGTLKFAKAEKYKVQFTSGTW